RPRPCPPCCSDDPAASEISSLSLHDALPIFHAERPASSPRPWGCFSTSPLIAWIDTVFPTSVGVFLKRYRDGTQAVRLPHVRGRSEEHTSELQSRANLVCRLLPEKKKRPREA